MKVQDHPPPVLVYKDAWVMFENGDCCEVVFALLHCANGQDGFLW